METKLAVSALAALAALHVIAAVAFGNPANASAANQNQPAAPQPTAGQCAQISNMSNKQVLDLARQSDQPAAFGALGQAAENCPVPTMNYGELRAGIKDAQQNQSLPGLIAATGALALGAAILIVRE